MTLPAEDVLHSPFRLLDLPPEILHLVCAKFCWHCIGHDVQTSKPSIGWHTLDGCEDALRSLCLVSREVCSVAQPVLFHACFVRRHHAGLHMQEKLSLLIRTFDERPSLALHMKMVDIDGFQKYYSDRWPYEEEPATREVTDVCNNFAARIGLPMEDYFANKDEVEQNVIQLLLLQLTSLETLNFCINRTWKFDLLRERASEHHAPLLPLVKHMELELTDQFIDSGNRYRNRNHFPIPTPESPVERFLIDNASNLELLCCTAGGLESLPALARLKTLQLSTGGSWPDRLPALMKGLPSLKQFSYYSCNEDGPLAQEVEDALRGHRNQLERLTIGMERQMAMMTRVWYRGKWRPFYKKALHTIKSLRDFTKLRSLTLDPAMIWPIQTSVTGGDDTITRRPERLAEFLPDSLEVLSIQNIPVSDDEDDDDDDGSGGDDLPMYPLAVAHASGQRFQNLRHVFWYGQKQLCHFMNMEASKDHDWLQDYKWRGDMSEGEWEGYKWRRDTSEAERDEGYVFAGRDDAFPNWTHLWENRK